MGDVLLVASGIMPVFDKRHFHKRPQCCFWTTFCIYCYCAQFSETVSSWLWCSKHYNHLFFTVLYLPSRLSSLIGQRATNSVLPYKNEQCWTTLSQLHLFFLAQLKKNRTNHANKVHGCQVFIFLWRLIRKRCAGNRPWECLSYDRQVSQGRWAGNKPSSEDDREPRWRAAKKNKTRTDHWRRYVFDLVGPRVQLFVLLALESSRQMAWPQGLIHYRLDYSWRAWGRQEA